VLSIDIRKGRVAARVLGSRSTPYEVSIRVRTLGAAAWRKVATELGRRALFAAKLLAGEMPPEVEKAFRAAGVSLFPERSRDLDTECSCPDWSNPCKHIAAVYYLLGEEFDRDPFLIFRLRGMEREALVGRISGGAPSGRMRNGGRPGGARFRAGKHGRAAKPGGEAPAAPREPEPLPTGAEAFWGATRSESEMPGEVMIPAVDAVLVRRLGGFPFWRGEEDFIDAMERVYVSASPVGLAVFLGEEAGE
jgi:uncharacterized Zn finger protein